MRSFIIASLLLCATLAIAADAPSDAPRSPAAKSAINKAEKAKSKAEQAYRKAVEQANHQLIRELTDAREMVMRGGGADALAEAQRIQDAIDAAKAELALATGQTFTIYAHKDWQATVEVKKGQTVDIKASGSWSVHPDGRQCGPQGHLDKQHKLTGYLEGRVGNKVFPVGSEYRFIAKEDGNLNLRAYTYGTRNGASGQIQTIISVH